MVKAPAKVEAGAAPNQNVSPHLLSPYFSLWHVHIPQKPWSLVCDKWSIKGANLAFTAEALAQLLPSKQKRKQQPPESGEEDKERQLSLEEALEAERERVRHKRQAFQEADARRQRAAAARQLEAAQ